MRYFTGLKYDDPIAFRKLKPPSGYVLSIYTFGIEPIVTLKDPKTKWIYLVSPEDITPDCQIKASAIHKNRHIATIGLYEAWDISVDLVPLSKIVKAKCRNNSRGRFFIGGFSQSSKDFFKDLDQRLQQLYKQLTQQRLYKQPTQQQIKKQPQKELPQKQNKRWVINHPLDEWIIASILGLIFLAIFGRKVD